MCKIKAENNKEKFIIYNNKRFLLNFAETNKSFLKSELNIN